MKKKKKADHDPEMFDLMKDAPKTEERAMTTATNNEIESDLLETNLSRDVETDSHVKSVSRELFNRSNIDLKTEVNHDEINQVTKIRFLEDKFGIANADVLIQSFLALRVSKERKSRREFVESLQTENKNAQGGFGQAISKLFGGGNNNG